MFRIKLFIFGLLGAALFLTSCGEDDILGGGTGTNTDAPIVSFNADLDVLDVDSTVEPGTTFKIQTTFEAQASDLSALRVYRDASLLSDDIAAPEYDNLDTDPDNNPEFIFADADKISVTYTYEFTAPSEIGFYNYEFEATDADGLTTSNSINIEVTEPLVVTNPTLELMSNPVITAAAGTLNTFTVVAGKGTYDIASISILEDGALIEDYSRIRFDGVDFDLNPLPLFSPESEGFTVGITIGGQEGTHDYIIRVTDTNDNSAEATLTIMEEVVETALTGIYEFKLFSNAAGPSLGGLDLDAGIAVSSASADAEIRDLGIDLGQPDATNWLQQVEPVNGSILKIVDPASLPEDFSFEDVDSVEKVLGAYNNGAEVDSSPVLQAGDIYAVSNGSTFYLLRVDEVVVTESDNEDYYLFSIKY